MDKTLEIKEGKKAIEKFIDFHKNNSLYYRDGYYRLKLDFSKAF